MKLNLSIPFVDFEGQPITDQKGEPLIMSKQIGNALFQSMDKESTLATYELAKKSIHLKGKSS